MGRTELIHYKHQEKHLKCQNLNIFGKTNILYENKKLATVNCQNKYDKILTNTLLQKEN